MNKLTASNLVTAIMGLPKNRLYNYVNTKNAGQIKIIGSDSREGPVKIKRFNQNLGGTLRDAKEESISSQMIWRIANAISENQPLNVDRILGASYNTRSVLEALLAHTPQFYYCYPGRLETINAATEIKKGHKHLLWIPNKPHKNGVLQEIKTDIIVAEVPATDAYFHDSLDISGSTTVSAEKIEIRRRHAQIQIMLYMIGKQLGFRTWIANNDRGIVYKNKRLAEYDGVINTLNDEKLIVSYSEGIKAALNIDCIWFQNSRLMPAVIEIEHSTGITSGLNRMKDFFDNIPAFPTRYVIAAADSERRKVIRKANQKQFKTMKVMFFAYSAIEELYALCQKRKIRGVTEEFLDCYMESVLST